MTEPRLSPSELPSEAAGERTMRASAPNGSADEFGAAPGSRLGGSLRKRVHRQAARAALAASFAASPSLGSPAETTAREPRVDYRIDARLDEKNHFVGADLEIRLENRSARALEALWFHAYLNAFSSEKTLFLRERGGRSGRYLGRPGRLVVARLESDRYPNVDLWSRAESEVPGDETDLRVPLPAPLPPGETLVLRGSFVAELPEIVERSGYAGDFHLVAQWFPKLAKLDQRGVFAHFPYHPYAEFFANFGTYEVTLETPRGYVVGSTGALSAGELNGERVRYRATAKDVHDFAWTAWPGYAEERFVVDDVEVRLLAEASELSGGGSLRKTAREALAYFSETYGRYPYPTLTIASPPRAATRAHGMEYPTFLTTGAPTAFERLGVRFTPILASHEIAHQWFYGIVASNEHDAPFLDEGLTSYAEWRYLERSYPRSGALSLGRLRVSRPAAGRLATFPLPRTDRLDARADEFSSFSALSRYVYGLTPLLLSTLEGLYGAERVDSALRRYVQENWLSHPGPAALDESLERELGADARALFSAVRHRTGSYRRSLSAAYDERSKRLTVEVRENEVLSLPVEFEVELRDGGRVRRSLPKGSSKGVFELPPPRVVTLDPDRKILIDDSFVDNRVRFDLPLPPPRAALRSIRLIEALRRVVP